MPWRRWKRSDRRHSPIRGLHWLPLALLAAGCASAPTPAPESPRLPAEEWRFVLSPLEGYPLTLTATTESALRQAAQAVAEPQRWPEARATALELLELDPGLHPARVLLAQLGFLARDYDRARQELEPVVDELPDYDAAQLLLGRVAEALGDVVRAYSSYRSIAEAQILASARETQLRDRALEIVSNRVQNAVERGRIEDASRELARLQGWAADDPLTLRAARQVAVAAGDLEAELRALSALERLAPGDRQLLERRAELELQVGEPTAGLRILQELSSRHPGDAALRDKLDEAQFLWRLVMLPAEAKQLVQLPEMSRGDFAALLYWLFPSVRYARPESGLIVNDIFDHPAREQIVRVVNLGLMSVDRTLHRFEPARPANRATAMSGYLRLLSGGAARPACLGQTDPRDPLGVASLCRLATRCALIREEAECLPEAPISGAAAAQMARRVLEQVGEG